MYWSIQTILLLYKKLVNVVWNTTSPIKQKSFLFALNAIFKTSGMFNKSAFYLYGNTAIYNWTWQQPKYEEPNIGFWLRAKAQ